MRSSGQGSARDHRLPGTHLRVGLTGGVASGKSTVAELLQAHGAVVIDSDLLAREVVATDSPGLAAVVSHFGPQVLTPAGHLDRVALGRVVFADPGERAVLEGIIHPRVRALAAEREAAAHASVVVQMIPLLVETGQQDAFDQVVVIDVAPVVQLSRLIGRDGLDLADAQARISAQASRAQRLRVADIVVDNGGELAGLARLVDHLWSVLRRRASQVSLE